MYSVQYPDQDFVQSVFDYRPTGRLYWKHRRSGRQTWKPVGYLSEKGYFIVVYMGHHFRVHRLIWIYHNGSIPDDLQIDHINGVRHDNRIENLRIVTNQENQFCRRRVKGCFWDATQDKYRAKITVNGKAIYLGYFDSEQEARRVYRAAKRRLHVVESRG